MTTPQGFSEAIPARVAALDQQTAAVESRISQYISARASAPSTEAANAFDAREADVIGPMIQTLIAARTATKNLTDQYPRLQGQFGVMAEYASGWNRAALDAINRANAVISNWQRQPAIRYDRLNASWYTRSFGQLFQSAQDITSRASSSFRSLAEPYVGAGAAVAEGIATSASGEGESRSSGVLGAPRWLVIGLVAAAAGGLIYMKYKPSLKKSIKRLKK